MIKKKKVKKTKKTKRVARRECKYAAKCTSYEQGDCWSSTLCGYKDSWLGYEREQKRLAKEKK